MAQLEGPLNIGQIAVACSLGYADFRLTDHPWRDGRPKLAKWIEAFNGRPAMKATYFARPAR
jgi:glutathione S-transferase